MVKLFLSRYREGIYCINIPNSTIGSMHIKPFQAVFPDLDYITSPDSFFESVRAEYNDYYDSGFFTKASQEALYVYQIKGESRQYTGLVACADIRDFLDGSIRQHEHTLAAKEQKQMQLMFRRKAAVKPVLLTYPRVDAISHWAEAYAAANAPFLEVPFEEQQQRHCFWEIRDGQGIREIQMLFETHLPHAYIADGHHRTSTTALLYERMLEGKLQGHYQLLLCAFFPSSDIDILDFNRVINGLDGLTLTAFMAHIAHYFEIHFLEEPQKPAKKHEITMFVNREWYLLRWKEWVLLEYADEVAILDALLLDDKILGEILGIADVRTDERIQYIEGPKGLEGVRQQTLKAEEAVGFCLYPVQLEELMVTADAGRVLPPKSTWFEPRMKNGLIVQEY